MRDDLRFATMEEQGRFTGQDALMAEAITKAGWNIVHLHGKCLYDQGPNPTMCARMGGVADRSFTKLHMLVGPALVGILPAQRTG